MLRRRAVTLPLLALLLTGCVDSLAFTPQAPTVPVLRLPMNDAYLGSVHADRSRSLRPKFVWEPSRSASSSFFYELQLSTDSSFIRDVDTVETTQTTYQPNTALQVSQPPPSYVPSTWSALPTHGGAIGFHLTSGALRSHSL
jgi:hypothetical protein